MAEGSKNEQAAAPALDAVKAEREADAAARAKQAGAAGGAAPAPSPSGDSPKPHGDKMANAVRGAASAPPKDHG